MSLAPTERATMSDENQQYELDAITDFWRQATRLSNDPRLSPEHREYYAAKAAEFQGIMERLGYTRE